MTYWGIIGGSSLARLESMRVQRQQLVMTPFGEPSGPLTFGDYADTPVVFLPRHGPGNDIAPHRINYRANVWALHHVGVERIIGVAAVGGISVKPGSLVLPDQLIDYTWGREHTYHQSGHGPVNHIEFSQPYCADLRRILIEAADRIGLALTDRATYGVTQGPRLETAMEIRRLQRDGCDLVGMTGMPEAALARELELCYASCSVVVNWAAGIKDGLSTMDSIDIHTRNGMDKFTRLLAAL